MIGIFIGEKRRRPFGQIRPDPLQRASKPCFHPVSRPRAPQSRYFYPHCYQIFNFCWTFMFYSSPYQWYVVHIIIICTQLTRVVRSWVLTRCGSRPDLHPNAGCLSPVTDGRLWNRVGNGGRDLGRAVLLQKGNVSSAGLAAPHHIWHHSLLKTPGLLKGCRRSTLRAMIMMRIF